ncbi:LOW QUALITY PROTEIN: Pol protein [Phytophthora palmivora]|uniref:Pol protein n=1 Tax=Phytophthora palmivora TaxID=4796 RepID=A0A2P4XV56_9STRA|nr:LOW QUALITY PROTEIN: Pol protein [Phytophthora palmivora]
MFPPLYGTGAPERIAKALAYAPEELWGPTNPNEDVAMGLATGQCRAVWASTVAMPDGTDQAGNIGPQAAEAAEESAKGVSCVGNIGPQVGNIGPQADNVVLQTAEAVEEAAEGASDVGNIVSREVGKTESKNKSALHISRFKRTNTRAEISLNISRVDDQVPHSVSETPPPQPVEDPSHSFHDDNGHQVRGRVVHLEARPGVSALLILEELSMKDFLAELKTDDIAYILLLKPDPSPAHAARLGPEIFKDPVYPLPKDPRIYHPNSHQIEVYRSKAASRGSGLYHGSNASQLKSSSPSDVGHAAGWKSPHSTPTFCVRKPNRKWRLVHAYNKLNNATVPVQTPIPRKDVLLNNMSGSTLYGALNLLDGYYQILMRESDIPLTAVSTPSGTLWKWLVMRQGLPNAPATFKRSVTQLFRPLRTFGQTYVDDIFVHSRVEGGQTAMEVHLKHLRRVFEVMRANKIYANIDKRVFASEEIIDLSCFVSRVGVRADPGKVKVIAAWTTPRSQKDLRNAGYAELARPLSDLLKKDADWVWEQQHQDPFDSINTNLQFVPVLALLDETKSFSVVCDASDYAIGCALLQKDDDGRERVISFQFRQLKAAERNYPVHDNELLVMKYALVKFRVHLLGPRPFVIFTDHASLRTATNSPHLSQRMARWLSFFAEYNFRVEYKPGKLNVLADALSRRPDYELAHISGRELHTSDAVLSKGKDAKVDRLSPRQRAQLHRFSGHTSAPLQILPVPADCWKSMSLDFVFGLPADDKDNTGKLAFVCRSSKMVHLAPVRDKATGRKAAQLFLGSVSETIVSDRDPRFTGVFWAPCSNPWEANCQYQLQTIRRRIVKQSPSIVCSKILFRASVLRHLSLGWASCLWLRLHSTMRYRVHPVIYDQPATPLSAINLAGRHRGLHRK